MTAIPADEWARAEAALGDGRVICQSCGTTLANYGHDTCQSPLDRVCEGFSAIEAAMGNEAPAVTWP
jgi:hypothetical protein